MILLTAIQTDISGLDYKELKGLFGFQIQFFRISACSENLLGVGKIFEMYFHLLFCKKIIHIIKYIPLRTKSHYR